jgi:hypothetical protein
MKENSNFKSVKVMKSTSKTRLKHLLLSITFSDKYWRSTWFSIVENVTQQQKSSWREIKFKQWFATTFRPLNQKKKKLLVYHSTLWSTLPYLHPNYKEFSNKKLHNNDSWHLASLSFIASGASQPCPFYTSNPNSH